MSQEKIIPLPGSQYAHGMVLVDPTTGVPYTAGGSAGGSNGAADMVADSGGVLFSPDSCAHVYGYTAGLLTTDVATGIDVAGVAASWTKTFSYTSGVLTAETRWVRA